MRVVDLTRIVSCESFILVIKLFIVSSKDSDTLENVCVVLHESFTLCGRCDRKSDSADNSDYKKNDYSVEP